MKRLSSLIQTLSWIEWFLLLQPFLDLSSGIFPVLIGPFSISAIVRLAAAGYLIIELIRSPNSKLKSQSLLLLGMVLTYGALHLGIIYAEKGLQVLLVEANQITKSFYFPVMLILLARIWQGSKQRIWIILTINALVISLTLLIPLIGGFANPSYMYGKLGWVGLFFSPNEIGSILVAIFPVATWTLITGKHFRTGMGLVFIIAIAGISIGTKVPLVGFITSLLIIGFLFINDKKQTHHVKPINALIVVGLTVLMISYSYWIQAENLRNQGNQYEVIIVNDPPTGTGTGSGNGTGTSVSPPAPNKFSKLVNIIFSSRDRYIAEMQTIMNEEDAITWMFGLGYLDTEDQYRHSTSFTVEVDAADLFYNYGIAGMAMYLFTIYRVLGMLNRPKLRKRVRSSNEWILGLSLVLIAGVSTLAGHVLTAPAVSVYVVFIVLLKFKQGQQDDKFE